MQMNAVAVIKEEEWRKGIDTAVKFIYPLDDPISAPWSTVYNHENHVLLKCKEMPKWIMDAMKNDPMPCHQFSYYMSKKPKA